MISSACGNPGFSQRPLWARAELLLHCSRPYCTVLATLSYGEPTALLLESPSHGVSFEYAQSVCHCSTFYAIPQHLLTMPLLAAEMLAIVPLHLGVLHFSWTPWECCSGVTGV